MRVVGEMYLRCTRNVEREDDSIDYRLLEVCVFGSYESTSSFLNDNDSLSSYSFSGNSKQLMASTNVKHTMLKIS